jgi:hypothetical protein
LGQRVLDRLAGEDGPLPAEVAHQALVGVRAENLPDEDRRGDHDDQPGQCRPGAARSGLPDNRQHDGGGDQDVAHQREATGEESEAGAEHRHHSGGQQPGAQAGVGPGQPGEGDRPGEQQERRVDHGEIDGSTNPVHGLG